MRGRREMTFFFMRQVYDGDVNGNGNDDDMYLLFKLPEIIEELPILFFLLLSLLLPIFSSLELELD